MHVICSMGSGYSMKLLCSNVGLGECGDCASEAEKRGMTRRCGGAWMFGVYLDI